MDYRNEQASPSKHLTGISVVIGVHLVMGLLVVSGVGNKIPAPTLPNAVVILPVTEKQVEPPKPRPIDVTDLPVVRTTVFNYPDIEVEQPRGSEPVKFFEPVGLEPKGDRALSTGGNDFGNGSGTSTVGVAPSVLVGVACPNSNSVRENVRYPAQAQRDGLQGEVEVEFTVSAAGVISGESIVSSTNRAFNSAALLATRQFKCVGQGQDVKVKVPYSFKLAD